MSHSAIYAKMGIKKNTQKVELTLIEKQVLKLVCQCCNEGSTVLST